MSLNIYDKNGSYNGSISEGPSMSAYDCPLWAMLAIWGACILALIAIVVLPVIALCIIGML